MASARRRELDIGFNRAVHLGRSAVKAAKCGYYVNQRGIKSEIQSLFGSNSR